MEQHEQPLWSTFRQISLIVEREVRSALAKADLTPAQYSALRAFAADPGASSATAARACDVTPQTMQTAAEALEKKGYLTRQVVRGQGRAMPSHVTVTGMARLAEAQKLVAPVEARLNEHMGKVLADRLIRRLAKLSEAERAR